MLDLTILARSLTPSPENKGAASASQARTALFAPVGCGAVRCDEISVYDSHNDNDNDDDGNVTQAAPLCSARDQKILSLVFGKTLNKPTCLEILPFYKPETKKPTERHNVRLNWLFSQ